MADTEKPDASDNKPHHHLNTDVEHSPGENQSAKEANDPNVVNFDGPDNPENPMNWSTANKTVAIAIVSMMTMLSASAKGTGNSDLRSALDTGKTPGQLCAFSTWRPLKMLMSPIVLLLSFMASQGDVVQVNKNVMHRDKDVWGEDADEFKSERWFGLRPYWDFVPHSGGPRRYPAQLLVTTEANYVVARFCQRSKAVENRDVNGYVPIMRAGPVD
ncbi:cytochrome P450 [Aspergillus oryzae]|uniref:Cytochrome P450 n=2 Tax=Aspergillus oryzae TaxID=5062 RepID=A0A1S9DDH0_ASPOZ|nr:cytochrome P450 [Aspergillus oryzae]